MVRVEATEPSGTEGPGVPGSTGVSPEPSPSRRREAGAPSEAMGSYLNILYLIHYGRR